jgi:Leucine-rich repeat (LRR) protein
MMQAMLSLGHSLTELDCSCNQIQALPAEIGRLSKLKVLHVVHNKLSSLPYSIGDCRSLLELHAGECALG